MSYLSFTWSPYSQTGVGNSVLTPELAIFLSMSNLQDVLPLTLAFSNCPLPPKADSLPPKHSLFQNVLRSLIITLMKSSQGRMDTPQIIHSSRLEEKTQPEGKGKGNASALTRIQSTGLLSLETILYTRHLCSSAKSSDQYITYAWHSIRGSAGIEVRSCIELGIPFFSSLLVGFPHTLHIQRALLLGPLPGKLGFLLEFQPACLLYISATFNCPWGNWQENREQKN